MSENVAKPVPLVLHAPGRGKIVVTACSTSAQTLGIAPGMPLGEAKALAVDTAVHFETHDPHADRAALRELAQWSQRFSPLVTIEEADEPSCLLLDITGCGPVFGGEDKLAAKVLADFRRLGYWVEIARADTVGAAWALAHYEPRDHDRAPAPCEHDRPSPSASGHGDMGMSLSAGGEGTGVRGASHVIDRAHRPDVACSPPSPPSPLPPSTWGEGRSCSHGASGRLHGLPVAALRLSPTVLQLLRQFDIRRIEQLLALSRKDRTRLDPEIVRRLDQALGHVPELLTFERTEEPIEFSWPFEPPIAHRGILEQVIEQLLEQILERVRPRQRGIRQLVCIVRTETEPVEVVLNLLQPSDSSRHLMDLVRLHFERVHVRGEVSSVELRAEWILPLEFEQSQLFDSEAGAERWRPLPTLIERLSQRLGETAVLRPKLCADAQPEFACRYDPWLREKTSPRPRTAPAFGQRTPMRPPCLAPRPIPITVACAFPGGPPECFQWQNQTHIIDQHWGPERIETGWWRHKDVRRDYYLVETTTGKRYWLYRASTDHTIRSPRPDRWCLHGTYG